MSLFENQSCPVCNRQFEDGDDIVCCPECGTPHHRECYNLIGHCVNRGLHKSNYSYYEENIKKEEPKAADGNNAEETEQEMHGGFFPPFPNAADFTKNPYDADSTTIDGEALGDVAATVRSNAPRFVGVFKHFEQNKTKASWNWGAFIFGHYYLFFRKMFKQAIILLCVNLTLSSVMSLLAIKLAPLTYAALGELAKLNTATVDANAFSEKINEITALADFKNLEIIYLAFAAAMLIIRICVAIFADYMYKDAVTGMIKQVNKKLEEGAAFNTPTLSPQEEESFNLSQEQLRRLYLSRRGGISIWAPCAAYIATYIINMITSI